MHSSIRVAVLLGAAMSLAACASVTRGTRQTFYFLSDPGGAKVQTSDGYKCTTPCKVKLKRKTEFTATVTKEGYKPGTANVESSTKGGGVAGAAGNIIAGGLIGIFVDGSNGSMNDLSPNPLKWQIAPVGSSEETRVVAVEKPEDMKDVKATKYKVGETVEPEPAAAKAPEPAPAPAAEPAPAPAPAPEPSTTPAPGN